MFRTEPPARGGDLARGSRAGTGFTSGLAVLFLINILNFYDRQALGAVAEPLRREFGLSDAQIGALTTAFTIVYAVAALPLGRLADRWSRKRLLALGTTVWAALTGLGGAAGSYGFLMATRLGVGIGEAVCGPVGSSWIGDLAAPRQRARAMAIFMMAVPIGGLLSFAVTGPAAQAWGWRIALAMAALPAAALVPALLWLKEPPRQQTKDRPSTGDLSLARLLRSSAFWWIVISGAVVNFALYSFSTFLPAFLTRFHGLSVGAAGLWTGIGAGASGIAGALTAASLGDRAPGHPARGRMMFAAAAAALAAPLALLSISRPAGQAAIAIPLIMAAYGLLQTYYGLVYAAIQDIVPPGLRGAAMGTYFMAMYLCGASFGPLLTGALSDRMARAAAGAGPLTEAARAYGLRDAMYVIPALSVVLALVLWAGAKASASRPAQE